MKVSYSNYPILEFIEKGSVSNMNVHITDKDWFDNHIDEYVRAFALCSGQSKANINVVSEPFLNAVQRTYDKLGDLMRNILNDDTLPFDMSGVFVLTKTVHMVDIHKEGNNIYWTSFAFHKTGVPILYSILAATNGFDEGHSWVSKEWPIINSINETAVTDLYTVCAIGLLKTYAEVEIKHLAPGQRLKDINCKYVNDTKLSLIYLDSKWFTTLVKSDAFKVRGHFRLQPYGHGLTQRKLIYITDYMKTGYTAPARKLSAGPQPEV